MIVGSGYRAERPEVRLLFAGAAWPQTAADAVAIRELAQGPLDADGFVGLVRHHRLVPLVLHGLEAALGGDVPAGLEDAIALLRELAKANAYDALRGLAELRRLRDDLAAAGVRVRVLKGVPLAQTLFGDLSLRAAGDLDLLVSEEDVPAADRVLRARGYRGLFDVERFSPMKLRFYCAHWKDITYTSVATGAEVDLHWRCFRNREMPGSSLCADARDETVAFGSFEVTTLARTETLLYLCVHGTLDGWVYLKSLADVAAMVRAMPESELDALAAAAARHGVLPELKAALVLVRRYFGMTQWSGRLLDERDRTVRHILRFAGAVLEGRGFLAERDEIPPGAMLRFELGLRRSVRYRRELLVRVLFRARMWETMPLPDWLFWAYPLVSPVEWVVFRVRRARG